MYWKMIHRIEIILDLLFKSTLNLSRYRQKSCNVNNEVLLNVEMMSCTDFFDSAEI